MYMIRKPYFVLLVIHEKKKKRKVKNNRKTIYQSLHSVYHRRDK